MKSMGKEILKGSKTTKKVPPNGGYKCGGGVKKMKKGGACKTKKGCK